MRFYISVGFAVLLLFTPGGVALADLADGLGASYPFSGDASDASGNGNHGAVHGAVPAVDRFGRAGHAYSFDGDDDYIDCGVADFQITDTGTILGWVKFDRNDVILNIVTETKQSNAEYAINLYHGNFGFFVSRTGHGSSSWIILESAQPIPTDEWLYFVMTYDGSAMRIYIDGFESASRPLSGAIFSGDARLFIGHADDDTDYFFDGVIDDIRIYTRVLTLEEIRTLHGCRDDDADGFCDEAYGGADCDDSDPDVHPGVAENCQDGIDNDCDGFTDLEDSDCARFTLEMEASYGAVLPGTLQMEFRVGAAQPCVWVTVVILSFPTIELIPIWMEILPVTYPPIELHFAAPFPELGWIGIYSGLYSGGVRQVHDLGWIQAE